MAQLVAEKMGYEQGWNSPPHTDPNTFFRKLFNRKEFYIIEILIVLYPSDVIVILISICLIEVTSIVVFCNLLCRFHMTG